jgi:hypothetical protein
MKAIIVGRSADPPPRPEDADSWGEFNARLEMELDRQGNRMTPVWWALAGVLFAAGLISNAYAYQGGHWWLWLCMLASLGIVLMMAFRAVDRADRNRDRERELASLQDAWQEHRSPTR